MGTAAPRAPEPAPTGLTAEVARLRAALEASERERAALAAESGALQGRVADGEAREAAAAEILRVISESPAALQPVLDAIAQSAARLCEAESGVWLHRDGYFDVVSVRGPHMEAWVRGFPDGRVPNRRASRDNLNGMAFLDARTMHVADRESDPTLPPATRETWRGIGIHSGLVVPLLRSGASVGTIYVMRTARAPFTERQIALLETFARQAVIAIENARLFQELQESHATLAQALERQTATAEVLEVISRSPADLMPVLGVIAEHAATLLAAETTVYLTEGAQLAGYAHCPRGGIAHTDPTGLAASPLTRERAAPRAVLDAAVVHIPNVDAVTPADGFAAQWVWQLKRASARSFLAVPLLLDGAAIGAIAVHRKHGVRGRDEPPPFSEQDIAVISTFAAQAVIALGNTRLFQRLQEENARRRQELERAASIQQRLLPSAVEGWPGVLEVAHRFRPAVETSGDFYDVLPLPAGRKGQLEPLQIAVGDVAGKGMSAALVTALARSALQLSATVPTGMATPAATLRVAGQRLHRDVGGGHFVACALAVVEPPGLLHRGPRLTLSNAAQVPVLLARDGEAREIEPPGDRLPLGARADADYKDAEVELRPGDVVVFSSDGLVEAPALTSAAVPTHLSPPEKTGELFGFARLAASAAHWAQHAESAEDVAAGMWADLSSWCGEESHHDDLTLLVLRVP